MPLTITPSSPAASHLTPTSPVVFTVEGDGSVNNIVVTAIYSGSNTRELVWDTVHGFNGFYLGSTNKVSVANDPITNLPISTYTLLRDGGWPADLTLEVAQGPSAGGGGLSAAHTTALRALTTPTVDGTPISLNGYYAAGDGGGGEFYWDASSTAADDGGTVFKLTGAATGRVKRRFRKGFIDPRMFGAVGDGVSHPLSGYFSTLAAAQAIYPHATSLTNEIDWVAWQAAVNFLRAATTTGTYFAKSGAVQGSKGVYLFDQPLEAHATLGLELRGQGHGAVPVGNYFGSAVQLIYTGSTATRFIDMRSSGSGRISDLGIGYSSPTWYGDLVDISHYNASDTQNFTMRDCTLSGTPQVDSIQGQGCRSLLFAGNAISSRVVNCLFGVARRGILFRKQDGSYSNAMTVDGCTFVYHAYSIVNAGESCQARDCIFEGTGGCLKAAYYDEYADVQAEPACTFTFAATGQTITRSSGDWTTKFQVGDIPAFWEEFADVVTGLPAANTRTMGAITALTATVMTVASGVVDEVRHADCLAYATSTTQGRGSPTAHATQGLSLTFSSAAHTIVRSDTVSFALDELFYVGLAPSVFGSASNDGALNKIVSISADGLTLYFGANSLVFSGNTITRTDGLPFSLDRWANGMSLSVQGTLSNNGDYGAVTVSGSTLTVAGAAFVNETATGASIYSLLETEFQAHSVASTGQSFVSETTTAARLFQSAVSGGPITFSGSWFGDQFRPTTWMQFGGGASISLEGCQFVGGLRVASFRQTATGFNVDAGTHVTSIQEPFDFSTISAARVSANVSGVAAADIVTPTSNLVQPCDFDCPVTAGSPTVSSSVIKRSAKFWSLTTLGAQFLTTPAASYGVGFGSFGIQLTQAGTLMAFGCDASQGYIAMGSGLLHLNKSAFPVMIGANGNANSRLSVGGIVEASPTSVLQIEGAIATPPTTKSADYSLALTDSFVDFDATAAGRTGTLPDATTCRGREYTIGKVDASANTVTIATTAAQTIDGVATKVLTTQYDSITVKSTGANWRSKK